MSIYCLSFEGGPLNDPIRNLLFDTAQGMMDEAVEARTVKTSTGEGEVTTENEQASMGAIYGTVFHANLDTNWGSFEVHYIICSSRTVRSKDCKWARED